MKYLMGIVIIGVVFGAWLYFGPASQESATVSEPGVVCKEFPGYVVITRERGAAVGEDILVKRTSGTVPCAYKKVEGDFELADESATYVLSIIGDALLLDEGTAPPPRGLSVYNLTTGSLVYSGQYNTPVEEGVDTFTFWQPIAATPTAKNCPDLANLESMGLGAGIETRVALNVKTGAVTDLGETRCSARQ